VHSLHRSATAAQSDQSPGGCILCTVPLRVRPVRPADAWPGRHLLARFTQSML